MKNSDIKKSLKRAASELPQADFDKIANAPITKMQEHDYITRQSTPQKPKSHARRFALAGALAAACLAIVLYWNFEYRVPFEKVSLDAGVGFEVVTSRSGNLISINGVDSSAQELLNEKDYMGLSIEEATLALLQDATEAGFLDGEDSAVLLTYHSYGGDSAFMFNLSNAIIEYLSDASPETCLYSQRIGNLKDSEASANEITGGKGWLISEIIKENPELSYYALAKKSISALIRLSEELGLGGLVSQDYSGAAKLPENTPGATPETEKIPESPALQESPPPQKEPDTNESQPPEVSIPEISPPQGEPSSEVASEINRILQELSELYKNYAPNKSKIIELEKRLEQLYKEVGSEYKAYFDEQYNDLKDLHETIVDEVHDFVDEATDLYEDFKDKISDIFK